MKNKPQNNPQKKVTKIVLVDAFTFGKQIVLLRVRYITGRYKFRFSLTLHERVNSQKFFYYGLKMERAESKRTSRGQLERIIPSTQRRGKKFFG